MPSRAFTFSTKDVSDRSVQSGIHVQVLKTRLTEVSSRAILIVQTRTSRTVGQQDS